MPCTSAAATWSRSSRRTIRTRWRCATPSISIEEALLQRLPALRYVVVVRNAEAGGWIALLQAHSGKRIDAALGIAAMADAFGAALAASVHLFFGDSVPLTPQGKPDREAIRALAHSAVTGV
jgi:fatty-acyl-CoA synthase